MGPRRVVLLALCACVTPLDRPILGQQPASLDLGGADCGGPAPAANWTLPNDGDDSLEVTATADAPFEIEVDNASAASQHFSVTAHAARTVHVVAPAAATNATPGQITTGNVHVSTNDPDKPAFDVALTTHTRGALLQFAPKTIDLGLIPVTVKSPPQSFTVQNAGNADVDVDLVPIPNPDFQVTLSSAHLAQQGSVQGTASFYASAPGDTKATVSLVAHGPVCGDAKLDVLASGGEGTFGFSPQWIDFGGVYCGDTAAPKTLTLLNGGNAPYKFDASFTKGTAFQVSPASGVVSTSVVLTITPLPIPAVSSITYGGYNDSLVITTDIPDDTPHSIDVLESAQGAILHFANPSDSFGAVQVGKDVVRGEQIINDGYDTVSFTGATSGDFSLAAGQAGSGSSWVNVTFHPQPALLGQKEQASFTLATTGHLCAPPPTLTVDATSHDQVQSVIALDDATCAQSATSYPSVVYCWGSNAAGQLGTNQVTGASTPRYVDLTGFSTSWQMIGGGGTFVAAFGGYVTWGTLNGVTSAPTQSNWAGEPVFASSLVACADVSGWLECAGKGGYLGTGSTSDTTTLTWNSIRSYAWFETGYDGHTCVYGADNNNVSGLYCFGPDDWGQLGDGNSGSSQPVATAKLVSVSIDPTYENVGAGDGFTCAYSYQNQDTLCWGRNTSSECGLPPSSSPVLTPNKVSTGKVYRLDAGRDFICADVGSSTIECWGSNSNGQLGDGGQETASATPVTVKLAKAASWLTAGNRHACAVLSDQRLQCWGSNTYGELGDGTTNDALSPVFVKGFD